jgi:hypothetical protein
MNNNLEFENEDPSPDSVEDNHPRTNYGEGYYEKETLEEATENYVRNETDSTIKLISKYSFKDGAKWEQERSYSEEEVLIILKSHKEFIVKELKGLSSFKDKNHWFEQFSKR